MNETPVTPDNPVDPTAETAAESNPGSNEGVSNGGGAKAKPAGPTEVGVHDLRNFITPRIFVAATRMDDGKTTTCVGLFAALQRYFTNIGYIKPVGQRFVHVEGEKIDEDSVLINETYRVRSPLKAMSPIAVEPDFTRKYLAGGNRDDLHRRVQFAFDEASWEKDYIIIEGTGHAGVGSVFDLSNALVAKLLHSKVVIVSQGGIGKPIDEIALNLALFEKHGVEVIGAILNKVIPEKMEAHTEFAARGLERMGLPLLGVVPLHQELRKPTLNQVCHQIRGEFLAGADLKRRRVSKVIIGAMAPARVVRHLQPGAVVITPGDRDDLVHALLQVETSQPGSLSGVVLTGDLSLPQSLLDMLEQRCSLPIISSKYDIYAIASAINHMQVKTEVGDRDKISLIQELIHQNVQVEKIIQLTGGKLRRPEDVLAEREMADGGNDASTLPEVIQL
ncbi:MAG: phosphotransacetylase family protein [Candidatus Methylacidiphilales bacterium]|nr:AAA family ATPase [Candidatus Methylacidiphilales bacterium]